MLSDHLGGGFFVEVFHTECIGEMIPNLTNYWNCMLSLPKSKDSSSEQMA